MKITDIPDSAVVTLRLWTKNVRIDVVGNLTRGPGDNWLIARPHAPGFAGSVTAFSESAVESVTHYTTAGNEYTINIKP